MCNKKHETFSVIFLFLVKVRSQVTFSINVNLSMISGYKLTQTQMQRMGIPDADPAAW